MDIFSSLNLANNHGQLTFVISLLSRKVLMTLSLFMAMFCQPNSFHILFS